MSDVINTKEFAFNALPETSYRNRVNGNFGDIRKSLRDMYSFVRKNEFPLDGNLLDRLKADFIAGHVKAMKSFDEAVPCSFTGKMNFLMPKGGFVDNNVQRLLLSDHHLSYAPMAVFVEST